MPPMFRVPERTSIEPRNDTNHMALSLESGTYEEVKEYLERNGCIVTGRPGDDHRLMANAGLLLPSTLALHVGLPQLVQEHLDLGDAPGWANTGDKMLTLVASALAGGDCIDAADVLRTGGTTGAIGCVVKAPSTLEPSSGRGGYATRSPG